MDMGTNSGGDSRLHAGVQQPRDRYAVRVQKDGQIADTSTSPERGPDGSERHPAAPLSVVFRIGLKYRRRLDIKGVLNSSEIERTNVYVCYTRVRPLVLLF